MTQEQGGPDPTVLTTQQLVREIAMLKELFFSEIRALSDRHTARFDGMDKAIDLIQKAADRVPSDVDVKVANMKELYVQRFDTINIQFSERDRAIDAALLISWKGEIPQPIPVAEIKIGGLPLGKIERTFPIAVVPQVLMPGRYVLEVVSVYNLTVFPVEREVEWRSTEFEVVREGSTSTVPITAYLFLADSSGESPSNLANEMPRLEASATVIATPESTSVPSLPAVPKPTVAIPSPTEAPNIPGSAPASTATPEPTPIIVPTPIDIPPIPPPHPLPPVDPPPIFIPPIPPIDVPPIDVPPVIVPPLPPGLP